MRLTRAWPYWFSQASIRWLAIPLAIPAAALRPCPAGSSLPRICHRRVAAPRPESITASSEAFSGGVLSSRPAVSEGRDRDVAAPAGGVSLTAEGDGMAENRGDAAVCAVWSGVVPAGGAGSGVLLLRMAEWLISDMDSLNCCSVEVACAEKTQEKDSRTGITHCITIFSSTML
ncbi:hypothetical protein [Citrobacter portucalensis]|uniref:hypothetical protein n=1 Tax=Citrobacter portucalensis TaxID=1639133 RepID=UPI0039F48CA3